MTVFLNSCNAKSTVTAHDSVIGNMTNQLRDKIMSRIPSDPKKTMQLEWDYVMNCLLTAEQKMVLQMEQLARLRN